MTNLNYWCLAISLAITAPATASSVEPDAISLACGGDSLCIDSVNIMIGLGARKGYIDALCKYDIGGVEPEVCEKIAFDVKKISDSADKSSGVILNKKPHNGA